MRTTVKSSIERFERKNYGWRTTRQSSATCPVVAHAARSKSARTATRLRARGAGALPGNTNAHASLVLEPQVEFSAPQVRTLKEFFADFFDRPATSNEARALAREIDALIWKSNWSSYTDRPPNTPFLSVLTPCSPPSRRSQPRIRPGFLTELARAEDTLLETKENVIDRCGAS